MRYDKLELKCLWPCYAASFTIRSNCTANELFALRERVCVALATSS